MSERRMKIWVVALPVGLFGVWEYTKHAFLMELPMAQSHLLSLAVETVWTAAIALVGLSAVSAHQRHQADVERKRFCREVLRSVTHGKLSLVDDSHELPALGCVALDVSLQGAEGHHSLRARLKEIAHRAGMSDGDAGDLALAVSEAATNAVKHAVEGRCSLYVASDRIVARISDHGKGIRAEDLPATVLESGFSTKVSLGMGYTLMLQLADRVWLATGPDGTTVQLEKWLHPEDHPRSDPAVAWQRL